MLAIPLPAFAHMSTGIMLWRTATRVGCAADRRELDVNGDMKGSTATHTTSTRNIHGNARTLAQTMHIGTHFILTPMDFLNACMRASVLLISREKISLAAIVVKGVSAPSDCAMAEGIAR